MFLLISCQLLICLGTQASPPALLLLKEVRSLCRTIYLTILRPGKNINAPIIHNSNLPRRKRKLFLQAVAKEG